MALSRRTGSRFQGAIWPGFVDAMTGLLLVLMFVLTIFMVVQYVLRETISGQESELDQLAGEVAALAQALGLEEQRGTRLDARLSALSATLSDAQQEVSDQAALISSLTQQRDAQASALSAAQTQITSFEAQVAALLADRDQAQAEVADLQADQTRMLSEQEALNLALAQARDEIDAGTEAARLAAARREALDALVADLRARNADAEGQLAALDTQLDETQAALSEQEAARLAEAVAARMLRERLETADAELTSMTLALEAQRRQAEETLTLLAAARAAEADLDMQLVAALLQVDTLQSQAEGADSTVQELADQRQALATEKEALEVQLAALQGQLDVATATIDAGSAETQDLRARLAAALADVQAQTDVAAEAQSQTADLRTRLQAALAAKLAAETQAETFNADAEEVRARLAAALAAKLAAENTIDETMTDVERRAALLQTAREKLAEEEQRTAAAQRQTEVLNQQVAALRSQLGQLQALLDGAKSRDEAAQVELLSLGQDLNTALARVAAEERRRRILEEEERKRLESAAQDLEKYRSEFFGRLRDVLGNQEGVRIEGDRFVFSSEVLFPPGAAEISVDGQREIAKIATILRSVISEIPPEINWVIRVDGHTDDVPLSGQGAFADNWELSQARALSVVKYMVNFLAIPPDRLSANGFGQYQPVNTADTEDARAQNRRIELKFTER